MLLALVSTLLPGLCVGWQLEHLASQPWAASCQARSNSSLASGHVGLWLYALLGYLFSIKAYHCMLLFALCALSCLRSESFGWAHCRRAPKLAVAAALVLQRPERLG